MCVDITNPIDALKIKFTVGNIYRLPNSSINQLTSFIEYFSQKLALFGKRANTFICRDYNINLLTLHSNEHTNNYFDGILSSGFLPATAFPTRISTNSILIDNIFVNKKGITTYTAILDDEISDHQVIPININLMSPKNKVKYITIYTNSEECKSNFKNDIAS